MFEQNNIGWAWWPLKKLGANNPLQIPSNANYAALLAYWNGETNNPPIKAAAYNGLMELAASARFEKNIIHRDVVDALMRQPHSNAAIPFKSNIITDSIVLNAVDYDLGSNGIAYFDKDTADYHIATQKRTAGNRGRVYRNDGVDIRKDSAKADSYYVSDIEDGEWLQYTVNVAQKGIYRLVFKIAADNNKGHIMLKDSDKILLQNLPVPNTGSMQQWQSVNTANISLSAGIHALRVHVLQGGFNLQTIQFVRVK